MFMCRSLEEFRETYLQIVADVQLPDVHYEGAGPSVLLDPDSESGSDSDAPQRRCYRLVVKHESF